jgi:plastocyanin
MKKFLVVGITCCFVLGIWFSAARAYEAGAVSGGGSISGNVKYGGNPPAVKKLDVTKDNEVCGKDAKNSPELIVGGGSKGIKNAVVYLANITKGKAMDAAAAEIDQKGCEYAPHVVVMKAGGSIDILNNDGILHNIHSTSKVNKEINVAQPKFKKKLTQTIEKPEIIHVKCDVHNWMSGVIVAADHPYYAVTDDNGAFKLADVPPGKYQVKVWHETLGEQNKEIEVKGGGDSNVSFELK